MRKNILYLIDLIPPAKLSLKLIPNDIVKQSRVKQRTSPGADQDTFGIRTHDAPAITSRAWILFFPTSNFPSFQFLNMHSLKSNPNEITLNYTTNSTKPLAFPTIYTKKSITQYVTSKKTLDLPLFTEENYRNTRESL